MIKRIGNAFGCSSGGFNIKERVWKGSSGKRWHDKCSGFTSRGREEENRCGFLLSTDKEFKLKRSSRRE